MANNQIALLAQMPEFETPVESQTKALHLRQLMNQGQASDIDLQQKRQSIQDAAGLRSTLAGFKPDTSTEDQVSALTRAGHLTQARTLAESAGKVAKEKREEERFQMENHLKQFEVAGQIMTGVKDQATWELARQKTAQVFGQAAADQMPVNYDPKLVEQKRQQAMGVKEQLVALLQERHYNLDVQKAGEDARHNKAGEGLTARGQNMVDARAKATAAAHSSVDGMLPDDTVAMMAQQYLAGDTSVMQNLGRGAQGAQNIIKLRNAITQQAANGGKGGADLAAQNSEYFGTKAGQRAAGTRIANVEMAASEAESLIPLARQASAGVARSSILPFGKAQVMFDQQTNDPALRKFAAANNALVNVYSRAISPSGTPTVADKEHAREMIGTAMDQNSYNAVLDQMQMEITAARAAPQTVRKAFNAAVTGKGGHDAAPAAKGAPAGKPSLSDIFGN